MGQQYCCGHRVKLPDLDDDLHITNLQLIDEIEELREKYSQHIQESKIMLQGEAIYRGKLDSSKQKVGYGEHYFKNYAYFGLFDKDEPNGPGLAIKDDLSYYKGDFKDRLFHGYGKEYGTDYSFEGQFEKGKRKSGLFKNDQFQYHGPFQENTFHGEGVILFSNGVRYEGSFCRGQMEGKGVLVFPSGKIFKGVMAKGKCKFGKFGWSKDLVKANADICEVTEQHEQLEQLNESPTFLLLEMLRNARNSKELQSTAQGKKSLQGQASP